MTLPNPFPTPDDALLGAITQAQAFEVPLNTVIDAYVAAVPLGQRIAGVELWPAEFVNIVANLKSGRQVLLDQIVLLNNQLGSAQTNLAACKAALQTALANAGGGGSGPIVKGSASPPGFVTTAQSSGIALVTAVIGGLIGYAWASRRKGSRASIANPVPRRRARIA